MEPTEPVTTTSSSTTDRDESAPPSTNLSATDEVAMSHVDILWLVTSLLLSYRTRVDDRPMDKLYQLFGPHIYDFLGVPNRPRAQGRGAGQRAGGGEAKAVGGADQGLQAQARGPGDDRERRA